MRQVLVAGLAVAALASAAAASIVVRATPRELADSAGLVVEGRVASVDVRWDDGRTCINTYVTFTVERTHKGTPAGSVVVKVPGGKVGEEEVRVEGTAKFAKDEEAVLFLWKDRHGEWIVLGEAQGKFLLRQDEKAGKRMAENSLKGLCLVMRGDPKDEATKAAKRPDRLSYDDLCAVVKASVDAAAKKAAAPGGTEVPATSPTTGGNATAPAPAPPSAPDGATGVKPAPAPTTATPSAPDGASGIKPAPVPSTGTSTGGQDPAPPGATPDLPSTSTSGSSSGGAPPPTKDAPAPPAGSSVPPGGGQQVPPSPEKK